MLIYRFQVVDGGRRQWNLFRFDYMRARPAPMLHDLSYPEIRTATGHGCGGEFNDERVLLNENTANGQGDGLRFSISTLGFAVRHESPVLGGNAFQRCTGG